MTYKGRSFLIITMTVIGLSLLSCVDLRDSEFQPDEVESRLPVYSEEGYDIAGALVNNDAWRAERLPFSEIMLLDVSKTDTLVFEMYGKLIDGFRKDDQLNFYIYQTGIDIQSFINLKKMEGKMILLDGKRNYAHLNYQPVNKFSYLLDKGTGYLNFTSIREIGNVTYNHTTGDSLFHLHPVEVSGTFELNFKDSLQNRLTVNQGRFDFKAYFKIN